MTPQKLTLADYYNKVYGGWLGRVIGSQLGVPLEFLPYFYIQRKYGLLNNYIKKITRNEVNDDEMYEIVGLLTLEQYGLDFTVEQLAQNWRKRLWKKTATAEKRALKNLQKGLLPPQTAVQNNPFYDFIGAQMRGEIWGLISPGCPEVAAKFAELDASISHVGEGVLGEVFIACLVSFSFIKTDFKEIIEEILQKFIPKNSNYYSIIKQCLEWAEIYSDWRIARKNLVKVWKDIRKTLEKETSSIKRKLILRAPKLHEIHVLPNAGIVTLGLLYGKGDFEKSICTTALCGYDTDCNTGNVGTILGVQLGADQIPMKWKDPLHDTFKTYVRGFQESHISKIAERICLIGEQLMNSENFKSQLKS